MIDSMGKELLFVDVMDDGGASLFAIYGDENKREKSDICE